MMDRLSPMMNLKKFNAYRLFWWVAVITVLLDQLSKWAIRVMDDGSISGVFLRITESFDIVFVKNTGAAWGVLSGAGYLLGILAIVVLVAIYLLRKPLGLKRVPMQWAFGLLVA
jgi:signal peptidase II